MGISAERLDLFQQMDRSLRLFIETVRNCAETDRFIYPLWTAKDIAAHITFWHESFAANLLALSMHCKPKPLRGKLSDLNLSGVEGMRIIPLDEIFNKLIKAHETIQAHIGNDEIISIPYRVGSRNYSPEEHLTIVRDHISKHTKDIVVHFKKKQKLLP